MADMYDDGGETPPESSKPESKPAEGASTALLPREFFGDKELKPGVRCEVEVSKIADDQVVVTKVPESEYKSEESHTMPDGSEMKNSDMEDMMA